MSADVELIRSLGLAPHPEGGWYRETWRTPERVVAERGAGSVARSAATGILFFLEAGARSRFHRIDAEELWCWQRGGVVAVHVLEAEGRLRTLRVGPPEVPGTTLHAAVPAGAWFAAMPEDAGALVTCIVAPGFEFSAFELAGRETLTAQWPAHAALIAEFTPPVAPGEPLA